MLINYKLDDKIATIYVFDVFDKEICCEKKSYETNRKLLVIFHGLIPERFWNRKNFMEDFLGSNSHHCWLEMQGKVFFFVTRNQFGMSLDHDE